MIVYYLVDGEFFVVIFIIIKNVQVDTTGL